MFTVFVLVYIIVGFLVMSEALIEVGREAMDEGTHGVTIFLAAIFCILFWPGVFFVSK